MARTKRVPTLRYHVLRPWPTRRGGRSDDAVIKSEMGRDRHRDKGTDDKKTEAVSSESEHLCFQLGVSSEHPSHFCLMACLETQPI